MSWVEQERRKSAGTYDMRSVHLSPRNESRQGIMRDSAPWNPNEIPHSREVRGWARKGESRREHTICDLCTFLRGMNRGKESCATLLRGIRTKSRTVGKFAGGPGKEKVGGNIRYAICAPFSEE